MLRKDGSEFAVPIFVVGFQRSGTTLLQALLGGHPDVAAPPETHFLFRIYDLRDYYGDLSDGARLAAVVHDLLNPPIPLLAGWQATTGPHCSQSWRRTAWCRPVLL